MQIGVRSLAPAAALPVTCSMNLRTPSAVSFAPSNDRPESLMGLTVGAITERELTDHKSYGLGDDISMGVGNGDGYEMSAALKRNQPGWWLWKELETCAPGELTVEI